MRQYNFCPECGGALAPAHPHGNEQLALEPICTGCGFIFWRASKPCVGALVVRNGRLLLVERAIEPFKGHWDIPGGFLGYAEAPEAGARREVEEETGLHVALTGFVGIFMDTYATTGEPTLNIFYTAEVAGGQEKAGDDACALGWFPLAALPEHIAFDCCNAAIRVYREQLDSAGRGL